MTYFAVRKVGQIPPPSLDIPADQAKTQIRYEDKLKVASELVPAALRPGGTNPLGQMYTHLSVGVHRRTDDERIAIFDDLKLLNKSLGLCHQHPLTVGQPSTMTFSARFKEMRTARDSTSPTISPTALPLFPLKSFK